MSAVIAENHYDGSRNVIGLFGGRRRYILTHPNQCEYMCVQKVTLGPLSRETMNH
jgi:hypothetical protein